MAYTATAWVSGDTISAVLANHWETQYTKIDDDNATETWTREAVRVYRSAVLSLLAATETTLGMDAESFDTGGFHDNTTNNERLTVPSAGAAGKYIVHCACKIASPAAGDNFRLRGYLNGTLFDLAEGSVRSTSSSRYHTCVSAHVLTLANGDYVHWTIESLNARSVTTGTTETYAYGVKIAP